MPMKCWQLWWTPKPITAKTEEAIDLVAVHQQLMDIEKRAAEATERHNQFLKALGLPLLPVRAGED